MWWKLWTRSVQPIAVEIGQSGVRLLQMKQTPEGVCVHAVAEKAWPGPLPEEAAARREAIVSTITDARRMGPFRGSECLTNIETSDLLLKTMRLPAMTDTELDSAVKWEAGERFGLSVDDAETAWIRAGKVAQGNEQREEIILVAVERRKVNDLLGTLVDAGLNPLAVDASCVAAARTFTRHLRRQSDINETQMIIDIGARGAALMMTRGQQISLLKQVTVGGDMLTHRIESALKLDHETARHARADRIARTRSGRELDDGATERAISEAVRPTLYSLAQEASLCLRYFSVTFRGERPSRAVVVGSEAHEPHLAEILSGHLRVPTSAPDPFDLLPPSLDDVRDALQRLPNRSAWASLIGLSLRRIPMEGQGRSRIRDRAPSVASGESREKSAA